MKPKRTQALSSESLLAYGCIQDGDVYQCILKLKTPGFYTVLTYQNKELRADVYDADTKELYIPFHVQSANGSFVSEIREEVEQLMVDMEVHCIEEISCRRRILDYVQKAYHSVPEYPWKSAPEHGTLKTEKGKWYGVIMHIPYKSLGVDAEGMTDVLNLKNTPERIQEKIDYVRYFPAYHMNKKYWISVLLDDDVSWDEIKQFIDESYTLVQQGKK